MKMKSIVQTGHTLDELNQMLAGYKDRYQKRDFKDVTILYARGDSEQKKNTMEYFPLRPCDMENFQTGYKIDNKSILVDFKDIPDVIRETISPDEPRAANIAFMFNEDTDEEEIFFLHTKAVHTMRRLPIDKTDRLTFARMHLMAEDILLSPDEQEIMPTMVTCTDHNTDNKIIIGFLGTDQKISISKYIELFLQAAGQSIYSVQDDMTSFTVVVHADNVPSNQQYQPCYVLTTSDTGYGAPIIACGWIDSTQPDRYFQTSIISLNECDDPALLFDEMVNAIAQFNAVFAKNGQTMSKTDAHMLNTRSKTSKTSIVSRIITTIPDYSDFMGDKIYHQVMEDFVEAPTPTQMSEFKVRSALLDMICEKANKAYSRTHIKKHAGAELLGLNV